MKWIFLDGPTALIWDENTCFILACLRSGDFVMHSCSWADWKPNTRHDASVRCSLGDSKEGGSSAQMDSHHTPFIVVNVMIDHVGMKTCEMNCIVVEGLESTSKPVHFKRRTISWKFDASVMIHTLEDFATGESDRRSVDITMDLNQEIISKFPQACIAREWESQRRVVHVEEGAGGRDLCLDSTVKGWAFSIVGMNLLHMWCEEQGEKSVPLSFGIEWMYGLNIEHMDAAVAVFLF
jgi:hypothetical protein